MGNIEIKDQSPQKRRKSIFKQSNYVVARPILQTKQNIERNSRNVQYTPIRSTSRKKQIFQSALTQRKLNTSRLNSSKFSNNKIYLAKNQQETFSQSKNISVVKNVFQQKNQQNYNNLSPKGEKSNIKKGKIVSNSRRNYYQNHKENYCYIQKNNTEFKRFQNTEIIKKVRNFNDFLNQIKNKLKQDKQKNIQRNKNRQRYSKDLNKKYINLMDDRMLKQGNYKNSTMDQNEVNKLFQKQDNYKQIRKLQVALKLQNQKLQLQKYRKLVERQLSKNHSIQSISLSTKKSGQRILTIQYDNYINYQNNFSNKVYQQQQKWKQALNNMDKNKQKQKQIKTIQKQKIKKVQLKQKDKINQQRKILQKLKEQYQNTMKNMIELGKQIKTFQNHLEQNKLNETQIDNNITTFDNQTFNYNIKNNNQDQKKYIFNQVIVQNEKINKIENLFSKLTLIQDQFIQTDREIKYALQNVQQSYTNDEVSQTFNSCKNQSSQM